MADEAYELAVALRGEGIEETESDLESVEESFDETADSVDKSASDMEGFASKWKGAMTAIVGGLTVAATGLLSKVPVINESMTLLEGIIDALAIKIDEQLRPSMTDFNEDLVDVQDAILDAEGPLEAFEELWRGIDDAVDSLALGAVTTAIEDITGIEIPEKWLDPLWELFTLDFVGLFESMKTLAEDAFDFLHQVFTDLLDDAITWGEDLVSNLITGIDNFISDLEATAGDVTATVQTEIADAIDGILGENGLVSDAKQWGESLIQEFVDGIRSKISDVKDAAGSAAQAARDRLPSSPAKEGPLSDLDETGPALAETFATGIEGGASRVGSATSQVAGAAAGGGVPGGGGQFDRLLAAMQNNQHTTVLELDGREVARSTKPFLGEETANRGRGTR